MDMEKYAKIIDLPHHVSGVRTPMPRTNRAAQFAPFAALTGYDSLIREAEREAEPPPVEADFDWIEEPPLTIPENSVE